MSYTKEAADIWDLDAPEPMQPIKLRYFSHSRERDAQVQTCVDLGLVCITLGVNVYAATDADSIALRVQAREQLAPSAEDAEVAAKAARLLRDLVVSQAAAYPVSAVRDASLTVDKAAQAMRAHADEILAAHGVAIKARVAATVEAA